MKDEENISRQHKETSVNEKKDVGYYFNFTEVLTYYFRKKDPNRPINTNLRMMHGINKISIIMFLFALIVIITRFVIRSL